MRRAADVEAALERLSVLSMGRQALQRVTTSGPLGLVHSSYTGAINIQTSQGLVCVVPREAGRGPLNLTLDAEAFARIGSPGPGAPVELSAEGVRFRSGFHLSISDAEVYEPSKRFARAVLPPKLVKQNISIVRNMALLMGHLDGVGGLLDTSVADRRVTRRLNAFSTAALPHATRLFRAIRNRDLADAEEASRGLVGLGIGLTPSGDDLLAGAMVTLILGSVNGFGPDVGEIAAVIAAAGQGRTTSLSSEFLLQAASGSANEKLASLVEAVLTGTDSEVRRSALDAIRVGETSGTDMVVGVVLGTGAGFSRGRGAS